ncbi:efflux RND transporter periplasmic adaptor subunit [Derxia gummosa]|uniref:Efflux RND transporter periplasmic adaptor subunit n=1 Tax=Derxia gummosa DSM 723 TaxID=1121388 RepID=A0A8B6XAQ5_9BURK|nr:efflux RND transporter periplasmic adaptor subunit [Derxia gummosa]
MLAAGGGWSRAARAVALALIPLAIAACSRGEAQQQGAGGPGGAPQAMPVAVVEVHAQQVPIELNAVGRAEGSKEVQVRARVAGILERWRFNEGDRVKAGATLFSIEREPYEIALAQAEANLAQARATAEQAAREADRLKGLVADNAISRRDYDAAEATRKTSAASVLGAEAAVRSARLNLSYTTVTAPISGVTGRALQSEGSLVTPGADSSLLTTVVQTDPVWVRFSLAEGELARIRSNERGAKVLLIGADGREVATGGTLNFTASTVDAQLGTVQLRASFANPDLKVLPGQFVTARVQAGSQDAFLVPQTAVMQNDKGRFVWIVGEGGKATPRPVEVAQWIGKDWAIRKGLADGDKVIVNNLIKLRPDAPVQPMSGPPPGADGAPAGAAPAGGNAQGGNAPASAGGSTPANTGGTAAGGQPANRPANAQ